MSNRTLEVEARYTDIFRDMYDFTNKQSDLDLNEFINRLCNDLMHKNITALAIAKMQERLPVGNHRTQDEFMQEFAGIVNDLYERNRELLEQLIDAVIFESGGRNIKRQDVETD